MNKRSTPKIRVLIVDDEETFRLPLAKALEKAGFDVSNSGTVKSILNADKNTFLYNVVLLDGTIGFNEGFQYSPASLVKQLKDQCPNVEVIICTGWGIDIDGGLEAIQSGAYSFMAKPVDIEELELAIRAAAFQHRNLLQQEHVDNQQKLITILFLAANPLSSTRLRLDEEIRAMDLSLLQSKLGNLFDIRQHWAVRTADLQSYLLRHNPHIVHFSGHGSPTNEIILEDDRGNSSPVSPRALKNLFSILHGNIKCVVLNACYSENQAVAIAEHVDCVVGMSKAIGDRSAISFASAFYQALGYGKDIKTAFDLGCSQIDLDNLGEQEIPRLLALKRDPKDICFVSE